MNHHTPALRFAVLLSVCSVLFLWRGIISPGYYDTAGLLLGHFPWRSELPMPDRADTNYLLTDLPTLVQPGQWLAAQQIRAGQAPLWNSYGAGGRPLLANNQSAVFSPSSIGHYLFGERIGLLWAAGWRLLAAGFGMWVLARRLGLRDIGAAFAGLLYAFSGPMVAWMGYPLSAVLATFPWLLAAMHALVHSPGPLPAAGLAAALGISFASGHAETTFKVVLTTSLWGAWMLASSGGGRRWATLRWTAIGGAVGGLLAAAPILPFLEYLTRSESYALRSLPIIEKLPHVPLIGVLAWLVPNIFGHPQGPEFWLENSGYESLTVYVGLAAPCLAVWALRAGRLGAPMIGLMVLAVLAAMGVYGLPPVIQAFDSWPVFRMSLNNRYIIVTVVTVVLLAARAVDRLGERPVPRSAGVTGLVIGAICIGAALTPALQAQSSLPPTFMRAGIVLCACGIVILARVQAAGLLVLSVVDLLSWGYRYNPVTPPDQHFPATPFIERLQEELADQPQRRLLSRGYIFPADAPLRYGIRDVKGHDAMEVARYVQYLDIARERGRGGNLSTAPILRVALYQTYKSPLLDALGAHVIVSASPLTGRQYSLLAEAPGVFAYRNERAFPRARLAQSVERMSSGDAVAERLRMRDHDPAHVTLLEGPELPWEAGGQGAVAFVTDMPAHVRLRVVTDAPGYLVLADVMYPGWVARVDGHPSPIWTADLAFRAVAVPAGEHEVAFRFRPRSVEVGFWLSAGGILCVAGLLIVGGRRRAGP